MKLLSMWVNLTYYIQKSISLMTYREERKGCIHNVKDFRTNKTDINIKREDVFQKHFNSQSMTSPTYLCWNYYNWINDNGYDNIEKMD